MLNIQSNPGRLRRLRAVLFFSLLALQACAPSLKDNPPREPELALPEAFAGASDGSSVAAGATEGEQTSAGALTFREFFPDPHLQKLIEEALENNQELNLQLQEMVIAQSGVLARKGAYLPKVDAQVGAGVEKRGEYTSQGRSDEANGVPKNLANFTFGLNASWEIDIWKKLRNATQAAKLRYLASVQGRNYMVTQIVAELANSYFELVALDSQLEILQRNIQIQEDAYEVVQLQKQAAKVTELAVQRFAAELLKNRSHIYDLQQQRVEVENRINFLVGRFPQKVEHSKNEFGTPLTKVVNEGLPSALLENRPDVKRAELMLQAAKLDVKVARAEFYPALSIEAGVGYEAFNAKHLVATPESLLYNLAGNLTAPLLNRNAIKAEYQAANAEQIRAVLLYEQTLLQAYTDVANQLAKAKNLKESYDLENQQVKMLDESIRVSTVLFKSARADYMEVLLTRRDALDAQMELIDTKLRQMRALVNMYQALGGGWRVEE